MVARGRECAAHDSHGAGIQTTTVASRRADPAAAHREIPCLYAFRGSAGIQRAGLSALAVDIQVSDRINALAVFGRVVHGHHAPVREDQVDVGAVAEGQARFIADLAVGHVPAAGQGDRGLAAGEHGVGRDLRGGDGLLVAVLVDILHGNLFERRRDGDGVRGHGESAVRHVHVVAVRVGDGDFVQLVPVVRLGRQRDSVAFLGQRGRLNGSVRGRCYGDGIGAGGHELLVRDLADLIRRQRAGVEVLRAVAVRVFQVLAIGDLQRAAIPQLIAAGFDEVAVVRPAEGDAGTI